MIILTDNIAFAQSCVPLDCEWRNCDVSGLADPVAGLAGELFDSADIMICEVPGSEYWDYLYAVENATHSQYDVLSRLANSACQPPDRTLCCAGSGQQFHGFKNRSWEACRGNIHLSAFLKPQMEVQGDAAGFIIAAVIAALQTAGSFELKGAGPAIKWVNDILIEGDKVGGVLVRLQKQGRVTESAVIGIGLNVEQKPSLKRDAYVPGVAAISDFVRVSENCRHVDALPVLMENLGRNLESLQRGQFAGLLDLYRQHSLILGRRVTVYKDTRQASSEIVARGLVESIGTSLELFIQGHSEPVTNGRLVMEFRPNDLHQIQRD